MKQVAIPRFCTWADVDKVAELSEKVLNGLADAGKSDYFGGVDADEIAAAMMDPSTVIVAEDERKDIIGFLLLQKPSEEEEKIYASLSDKVSEKRGHHRQWNWRRCEQA